MPETETESKCKPYSNESISKMARLVSRAAEGRPVDGTALNSELLGIAHAIHGPIAPELAAVWNVPEADARTNQERAALFAEAATLPDPLEAFFPHDVDFARLDRMAQLHWKKTFLKGARPDRLRGVDWFSLPAAAQDEVREACRSLAVHARLVVRRGRPARDDLTTHLQLLADLFIQLTGSSQAEPELPVDPKSRFIRFASLAVFPFYPKGCVTSSALSARWRDHVRRPNLAAQA